MMESETSTTNLKNPMKKLVTIPSRLPPANDVIKVQTINSHLR